VAGLISMIMTDRFQRLGDLAANTLVVYAEQEQYDPKPLEGVAPVAPAHAMTEVQQAAFINFAVNRGKLSQARQSEIAEIIRPRIPARFQSATDYVRGVGKWLLGAK